MGMINAEGEWGIYHYYGGFATENPNDKVIEWTEIPN